MPYNRTTTRSLTGRNVIRRRQRRFNALASTHPTLIMLYKIPEVAMFAPEIESVMADFYDLGIRFAIMESAYAMHTALKGDRQRQLVSTVKPF